MFNKKNTEEEQDTLDWGSDEDISPVAAPAPAADNIYQPAAGCIVSQGTVFTGNIEANDNVVLEGRMVGNLSSSGRVRIQGKLEGDAKAASLLVDKGEIVGNISADESVTVEPGSTITGDITAVSARVNGTVIGNLKIAGQLTLCSKAVLTGDLVAASVVMEAGSVVKGHFQVG